MSQPLIGGENYPTWAQSMERALKIKNKFWLIDGSASLTLAMEKIPLLVQSWVRCNDIVVSWIINCISPKIVLMDPILLTLWSSRLDSTNGSYSTS